MRGLQQCRTLRHSKVGSNQQHGTGATETSLKQLVLIYDKVFVEHRNLNPTVAGGTNELIRSAKKLLVGKNAECRCTVLLVAERNDVSATIFFDPSLRGLTTFKLGNNTRIRVGKCL